MPSLSELNKYYRLPLTVPNIPLLMRFPTGEAGTYTINRDSAVICDKRIIFPSDYDVALSTDGYIRFPSAYANGGTFYLPPKTGNIRKYKFNVRGSAAPTAADTLAVRFNIQNTSNYWVATLIWDGTSWDHDLFEVISGSGNTRAAGALSSAVAGPAHLSFEIWDCGDTIVVVLTGYETDTTADHNSQSIYYYAASRSKKEYETFSFGNWTMTNNDTLEYGSVMVEDF